MELVCYERTPVMEAERDPAAPGHPGVRNKYSQARGDECGGSWWAGAALYQVYVRSWRDSDGDGSGDLVGIREKLPYLKWLGVDGLWLSPTMPSDDADWGYDVFDYEGVHPALGSLEDLDSLIAAGEAHGLAVLLDLVPSHTSSSHPWFVSAQAARTSPYRDYYVWADPSEGGGPPNNWLCETGQSAWTFSSATGQYYLHNFLESQPDLNWWNQGVRGEFARILRFWFDRGVAGFRIDVPHCLLHDRKLRDEPVVERSWWAPQGREPTFSKNRPGVHAILKEWRSIARTYDPERLLLGETWVKDVDRLVRFYGEAGDELQLAFNFPVLFSEFSWTGFRALVEATLEALPPDGCPVWTGSNHDVSRFPSRWCGGDVRKIRAALTVLSLLPGTFVLYYGDELGLTDRALRLDEERDPMTAGVVGVFHRDWARTPMPWSLGKNCGFSLPGAVPWLPIGPEIGASVSEQMGDPDSVLVMVRELLALREDAGKLARDFEVLGGHEPVWKFRSGQVVVSANLSDSPNAVVEVVGTQLFSSVRPRDGAFADRGVIRPWEVVVERVEVQR